MAKLTDVVDFPTPPLPDPTAINRLTLDSNTFSTVLSVLTLSVVLLCLFYFGHALGVLSWSRRIL